MPPAARDLKGQGPISGNQAIWACPWHPRTSHKPTPDKCSEPHLPPGSTPGDGVRLPRASWGQLPAAPLGSGVPRPCPHPCVSACCPSLSPQAPSALLVSLPPPHRAPPAPVPQGQFSSTLRAHTGSFQGAWGAGQCTPSSQPAPRGGFPVSGLSRDGPGRGGPRCVHPQGGLHR